MNAFIVLMITGIVALLGGLALSALLDWEHRRWERRRRDRP